MFLILDLLTPYSYSKPVLFEYNQELFIAVHIICVHNVHSLANVKIIAIKV